MRKYLSFGFMLTSAMLIISCNSDNENNVEKSIQTDVNKEESTLTSKPVETENTIIEEREPTDSEIREYGRVIGIEDGAYPMFIITVEFPERNIKHDFNLNNESIDKSVESLYNFMGKYATIYYLSELENFLLDIHLNGISLMGEYAPKKDTTWKTITGIFEGAEKVSGGDLPDEVSVTDKLGKKISFKQFITPEMVAANGKIVEVFYYLKGQETITYIRTSEN